MNFSNDNKPSMFGLSAMFDPTTHEPRSSKSALTNELMAEFAGKSNALVETIIGHTSTRNFVPPPSGRSVDYSPLVLTDAEVASLKVRDE